MKIIYKIQARFLLRLQASNNRRAALSKGILFPSLQKGHPLDIYLNEMILKGYGIKVD